MKLHALNNSFLYHKMIFFSLELDSSPYIFAKFLSDWPNGHQIRNQNRQIIHKHLNVLLNHIKKYINHAMLKSDGSITKTKWHFLKSKSTKGTCKSDLVLVLRYYGDLGVTRVSIQKIVITNVQLTSQASGT